MGALFSRQKYRFSNKDTNDELDDCNDTIERLNGYLTEINKELEECNKENIKLNENLTECNKENMQLNNFFKSLHLTGGKRTRKRKKGKFNGYATVRNFKK